MGGVVYAVILLLGFCCGFCFFCLKGGGLLDFCAVLATEIVILCRLKLEEMLSQGSKLDACPRLVVLNT